MKAVFLGKLATSQAAPITGFITEDVRTEIVDDGDPARLAAPLADADIVLTGAWANGYPPAPRLRLLQVPLAGTDGVDERPCRKASPSATPMATRRLLVNSRS